MAVKTIYQITHSCGHIAERDLGDRRADERAGLVRWLTERPCSVNCTQSIRRDPPILERFP
jgi:hypothetical protein